MGSINNGNQKFTYSYKQEGLSKTFNSLNYKLHPRGIYSGGNFAKVSDTAITLSPTLLFFEDNTNTVGVRIETTVNANIAVQASTPYIVGRFVWINTENNYMDFLAIPYGDIEATDIVFGKLIFNGSVLTTEYDYSKKQWSYDYYNSTGNSLPLFKVECNEPYDDKVQVHPGSIFFDSKNINLVTITQSPSFSFPVGVNGRTDIVIINSSSVIEIVQGEDSVGAPSPIIDSNKFPIAVINFPAGATQVRGSYINYIHPNSCKSGGAPILINAIHGGTGFSSYTIGDILYASSSTELAKLNVGATGQVLTVESGIPTWGAAPGASTNALGVYFSNNELEANVTGWTTYADTAGSSPVDGTGGSPNVTFTYNSTNPLLQLGDGLFSKDASNRQGQGVSYNFSIDRGIANGTTLQISFLYKTSTNFAFGDVGVYIYDVTNNVLITPTLINLEPNSTCGNFNAFFTTSNSLSYRFILHVASTNALAYTFNVDHITIKPSVIYNASAIGGWVSYTPTITGCGTCTNIVFKYRRVGTAIEVFGTFTTGTVAGSVGGIGLPSGLTLTNDVASLVVGQWSRYSTSTNADKQGAMCASYATYTDIIAFAGGGYATNNPPNTTGTWLSTIFSNSQNISVYFTVPIAQWSSNINLATDFTEYAYNTDTTNANDTTSFGYGTDGAAFPSVASTTKYKQIRFRNPINVTDKLFVEVLDTNGRWLPENTNGLGTIAYLRQGTTEYGLYLSSVPEVSTDIRVYFTPYASSTNTTYGGAGAAWSTLAGNRWRVRKVSNGNMAEMPSIVACDYRTIGVLTHPGGGVIRFYDFSNKYLDTNNAVLGVGGGVSATYTSTWRFVAPLSGLYQVNAGLPLNMSSGGTYYISIYKNGNEYIRGDRMLAPSSSNSTFRANGLVNILAGDSISIAVYASGSVSTEENSLAGGVNIARIG